MSLGGDREAIYHGRIRAGRHGILTKSEVTVWRCKDYDIAFLDGDAPTVNYESDDYREMYNGSRDSETFFALHDSIARRYIQLLDGITLRGQLIADIGCGAGSFLDLLQGVARDTVGIEPNQTFYDTLAAHGHRVYSYATDFLRSGGDKSIDIAVSFHVVEHVDDPRTFLRDVYRCLRPGGQIFLATPNLHDVMLRIGGEPYKQFFYRTAHRWYFSGSGLARLVSETGFHVNQIGYLQEYDLGNAFSWLRECRPCGNETLPYLNEQIQRAWMAGLEASGIANVTYIAATRPA